MENKKAPVFAVAVSAVIIGVALFEGFDFQNLSFEKPALAVVYALTLGFCMYVLIRHAVKKYKR